MSRLDLGPGRADRGDGGLAARRAVMRWAWRLFHREWRQQALVVALLGVAVAAAVGVASVAYNLAPADGNAEFGSARGLLFVDRVSPLEIDALVAAAEEWFGSVDVIGYQDVPVPGGFDPVRVRAQDPAGRYGGPMLSLREGRYPAGPGEVALTDGTARDLQVATGDTFDVGGSPRSVVGVVENPNDLDDEFGLVAPMPRGAPDVASVAILVGSTDRLASFRAPGEMALEIRTRAGNEGVAAAAGVLVVAEVLLLLVSLVAAAGFVVVAQRRLRQLGMLAAIGATERHLRLVMVANGAVVGAIAASIGGVVGLAGWWLVAPSLETAARQRIDRFDVPWWLIGTSMVLAVATATAAAWWPARVVARVPVTSALSGRPPHPRPVHTSAALAGGFVAAGLGALVVAGDVADDVAVHWANALLVSLGTLSTIVGVLLLGPLVVRLMSGMARWAPIALRLALRDLARYQARSAVALAAISLGLGIPVAVVVGATAAQHGPAEGNLSANQILVRADSADDAGVAFLANRTPAQLGDLEADVNEIAARLDADATVVTLEAAFDPGADPLPDGTREVVALARRAGEDWRGVAMVYVASPDLLERLGLDPGGLPAGTQLVTSEGGAIAFVGAANPPAGGSGRDIITDAVAMEPGYTSLPRALITADGLTHHGWAAAPSAWLIETSRPLTGDELAAVRDQAVAAGVTLEARRGQGGLAQLRSGATALGVLLALGVLAMTVGLLRTGTAGDLRTLTATGATSTVRRTLTAATAGGLALGGVLLGTAGAYAGLIARSLDDDGTLTPIPVLHLTAMVLGIPLVAATAGWLLTSGEPPDLARQPLE